MEKESMVSLEVSEDMIKALIEKRISAAIVGALGDSTKVLESAVTLALRQKVSNNGSISRYSSDNKFEFVEVMAGEAIRKAAKKAMQDWLTQNSEKVRDAVIKEMKKPKRVNSIAQAFANSVEQSIKTGFRVNCDVAFESIKSK